SLVKHYALRNDLPLTHSGAQGRYGRPRIDTLHKIAEHIPPGIIVQEGHLIELPPGRLIKDFLQAVPMLETMRVMAFIETPLGPRRGWRLGLLPGVLHPLDGRGADRRVRHVLEFPG